MYIWERRGLGEATSPTPGRVTSGLRSGPPYLRFDNLDRFDTNKADLTDRLRTHVRTLAGVVKASLEPSRPINVIRLVGHTDNTGKEAYNLDLGKRRAEAVQDELVRQLTGLLDRVVIIVEPSPGASKPSADNRTAEGRARNRRVEVFIGTRVTAPASRQPPPPPKDWREAARDAAKQVEEEAAKRRKQGEFNRPLPPSRRPKSLNDRLDEELGPLGWLGAKIREYVLKGACQALEILLSQAGARLNDKQKEDLRKECLDFANRPM